MNTPDLDGVVLVPKAIDNSQVVREVDPRSHREIGLLLVLVGTLVAGMVLYAWPSLELRQAGRAAEELSRERERLIEGNRKLRLERALLQDLRRVEAIAIKDLGLSSPPPERVVVVETPVEVPPQARLVSGGGGKAGEQ